MQLKPLLYGCESFNLWLIDFPREIRYDKRGSEVKGNEDECGKK